MTTRFASLPPALARVLLALVALTMAAGMLTHAPAARSGPSGPSDVALYRAIAARSASVGAYHDAAVAMQRARGYPLRPFVAVREPALALVAYRLGPHDLARASRLLAIAIAILLALRLRAIEGRIERIAATVIGVLSILMLAQPAFAIWHEVWAGLLLATALLGGGAAVLPLALAALAVRELALPAVLAVAAAAELRGRRREAVGWIVAAAGFAVLLALHAGAVWARLAPGDAVSPGWAGGGLAFPIDALRLSSLFNLLPRPLVAAALPLALLGWVAPRAWFAGRIAVALTATIVAFAFVGRPDNLYWGLIAAPLLPAGLAFAPAALRDLARQAQAKSPSVRACPASASS